MIKVNLAGRRKAGGKTPGGPKFAMPTNALPFVHIAVVLAFAAGGYYWYSSLTGEMADLDSRIQQAETQKKKLEEAIQADSVFESRSKEYQKRVDVIEGLRRNQLSPVIALDALSQAIDNTEYVWLSSLSQTNAVLSMSGQGTSYEAVAKFLENLKNGGYFINIDTSGAQLSGNLFTFSLKCEFAPRSPAPLTQPAAANSTAEGN